MKQNFWQSIKFQIEVFSSLQIFREFLNVESIEKKSWVFVEVLFICQHKYVTFLDQVFDKSIWKSSVVKCETDLLSVYVPECQFGMSREFGLEEDNFNINNGYKVISNTI